MVSKYIRIVINSMKRSFEFEKDFFLYAVFKIFIAYLLSYLWGTPTYFAAIYVIRTVMLSPSFLIEVDNDIRSGKMVKRILLPMRIDVQYLFENISLRWLRSPLILIYFLIFPLNPIGVLRTLLFLPLIHLLQFYLAFLIGATTFKTQSSTSFYIILQMVMEYLLGGKAIPIWNVVEIFGEWVKYSPFTLLIGRIYEIYIGENLLEIFFLYLFWIFVLLLVSNLLWKKCTKNFEGYGV